MIWQKRLRPRSVRTRLALWHAVAFLAAAAVFAGSLYFQRRGALYRDLDIKLRDDFEAVDDRLAVTSTPVADPAGGIPSSIDVATILASPRGLSLDPENWLAEVWHANGTRLFSSGADGAARGTDVLPAPESTACKSGQATTVSASEGGLRVRVFCQRSSALGPETFVWVARSTARLDAELGALVRHILGSLPLVVILAALLGYVLARTALKPVARMASQARTITAQHLGERLQVDNPNDELGHLALAFNEAISGLERSFAQMRRFTADASHELRTPLTAIHALAEVAMRSRGRSGKRSANGGATPAASDPYDTIASVLEESDRLRDLCEKLLLLTRADAGQYPLHVEPVLLSKLVGDMVDVFSVLAEERQQSLEAHIVRDGMLSCDVSLLKQALANLIDNAIKYGGPDNVIQVLGDAGGEGKGNLRISVTDRGPGIGVEHQERVFDRFYRIDSSRGRAREGVGLGLALTQWAVEVHRGRIRLDSRPGAGACFTVELPRT